MTPNEIIASYITSLPPAIRPDVCCLLLLYLSDCQISPDTDIEKEALEMLRPTNPAHRFRAVLCVSAYLDYLFATTWGENRVDNAAIFRELAEKTGRELWETAALRQPLTEKYRDVARRKWVELRQTRLTHDRIADWQHTLDMERIGILSPTE